MSRQTSGSVPSSGPLPDKITVAVTKRHIAKGERGKPSHCPVALALRSVGLMASVDVGMTLISRGGSKPWLRYEPSGATSLWILRYDEQETGELFQAEFTRIGEGQ